MNKKEFLEFQMKKAVELLESGKKVQLEIDTKNCILRICEITTKKVQFSNLEEVTKSKKHGIINR